MVIKRKILIIIVVCFIIATSIVTVKFLGNFYLERLSQTDNQYVAPTTQKIMVLRLEPYSFHTIQLGIFPEKNQANEIKKKLIGIGLYPYITKSAPYKVWLGCFSEIEKGEDLVKYLTTKGFEAFIGKGLVNDRALKFPSENIFMKEKYSPFIGKYNLIISHSLKMFKSTKYEDYDAETWQDMISKIQLEIDEVAKETDEILAIDESADFRDNLKIIRQTTNNYSQALNQLKEDSQDKKVLYCQGYLLELIASYHSLITESNSKLGIN
ncbi:hypothetical protein SAMN00017405_1907 [Desulfonispora thiosulfatigenes DSM 11270]|uniref:Sporulation related domain-containing protein n=1 Tax=Desulfonispora thiosulfatigenes DSM 11270 TaxID=656914 RepID=A0A1W1VFH0_DESTI|nr:SPOR domain-containing protein [Desulfonispora thiosulfatigenes]SMB92128.1 hypothetical protein SAMN00017405_1907 [Desulfonispora thiosulfatigenes DSM 11270]